MLLWILASKHSLSNGFTILFHNKSFICTQTEDRNFEVRVLRNFCQCWFWRISQFASLLWWKFLKCCYQKFLCVENFDFQFSQEKKSSVYDRQINFSWHFFRARNHEISSKTTCHNFRWPNIGYDVYASYLFALFSTYLRQKKVLGSKERFELVWCLFLNLVGGKCRQNLSKETLH